jgi:hypothetical protein
MTVHSYTFSSPRPSICGQSPPCFHAPKVAGTRNLVKGHVHLVACASREIFFSARVFCASSSEWPECIGMKGDAAQKRTAGIP